MKIRFFRVVVLGENKTKQGQIYPIGIGFSSQAGDYFSGIKNSPLPGLQKRGIPSKSMQKVGRCNRRCCTNSVH